MSGSQDVQRRKLPGCALWLMVVVGVALLVLYLMVQDSHERAAQRHLWATVEAIKVVYTPMPVRDDWPDRYDDGWEPPDIDEEEWHYERSGYEP